MLNSGRKNAVTIHGINPLERDYELIFESINGYGNDVLGWQGLLRVYVGKTPHHKHIGKRRAAELEGPGIEILTTLGHELAKTWDPLSEPELDPGDWK